MLEVPVVEAYAEAYRNVTSICVVHPEHALTTDIPFDLLPATQRKLAQYALEFHRENPQATAIEALAGVDAALPVGKDWRLLFMDCLNDSGSPMMLGWWVERLRQTHACMIASGHAKAAHDAANDGDMELAASQLALATSSLDAAAGPEADTVGANALMTDLADRLAGGTVADVLYTGLACLDSSVSPVFAAGRLVVLAARPGRGKTALALNVAAHVAKSQHVLYWCGEMKESELAARVVAAEARVPLSVITQQRSTGHGALSGRDRTLINGAMGRISEHKVNVSTVAGMTVERLDAIIRRMIIRQEKPSLVVVDYMQRMRAKGMRSREEEVGAIVRGLKEMAKEHDTCVLALAQMNRAIEGRASRKPLMSDLRESGQIEQEADAIIFPDHGIEDGEQQKVEWPVRGSLDLAKFRHGPTAVLPLYWHGPFQTWSDG